MSHSRRLVVALLPGLALAPAAAAAGDLQVTIDDFAFVPEMLQVAAGTTVRWTNRDDSPHTVVSDGAPRVLRSPPMDTGGSFAFTFAAPGTYRYYCSLHPHMQGVVMVR